MRTYRPTNPPNDPAQLPGFLRVELGQIQKSANRAEPFIELEELHAVPDKLRTGITVLADGTDWDPGSGAGVYTYYGGAWHKLG